MYAFVCSGCRTGEAKVTKGYKLAARSVIHTVGPRYNGKYRTAAENALFNCYRNILLLLRYQRCIFHRFNSASILVRIPDFLLGRACYEN